MGNKEDDKALTSELNDAFSRLSNVLKGKEGGDAAVFLMQSIHLVCSNEDKRRIIEDIENWIVRVKGEDFLLDDLRQ